MARLITFLEVEEFEKFINNFPEGIAPILAERLKIGEPAAPFIDLPEKNNIRDDYETSNVTIKY